MAEAMYYQVADPSVLGRQYSALGQTFTVTDFDDDDLDVTVTMLRRMKNMMKTMMKMMSPGCNCGQLFLRRPC